MKISERLVAQWWRNWSVWLLGAAIAVAEIAPYLPELQEILPADWYRWAFRLVLVARIIRQTAKGNEP